MTKNAPDTYFVVYDGSFSYIDTEDPQNYNRDADYIAHPTFAEAREDLIVYLQGRRDEYIHAIRNARNLRAKDVK